MFLPLLGKDADSYEVNIFTKFELQFPQFFIIS